ncbi:MAG: ribonuclease P protein component [Oscillospiraceae bacterium]|jgi:ribonuclease P protein component|nr:ribonuclease P protein component [Oscillospiraceae bacterium]
MKYKVINKNKDFQAAYSKGSFAGSSICLAYFRRNGKKENRMGISTPKKVGNAVKRSRARRIIRAAYADISDRLPKGYDIILCARPDTPKCKSTNIRNFLEFKLLPKMNGTAGKNGK